MLSYKKFNVMKIIIIVLVFFLQSCVTINCYINKPKENIENKKDCIGITYTVYSNDSGFVTMPNIDSIVKIRNRPADLKLK
jgi:hypothetical protein